MSLLKGIMEIFLIENIILFSRDNIVINLRIHQTYYILRFIQCLYSLIKLMVL